MLQTLLWGRMTCFLTFLKYPLAVLAQTPAIFWCVAMHFQRLLLLFVASNSGKWYWDWTLSRIRSQIELSCTFFYDYKMSTSGNSASNSRITQGGRTTMMTMPVNRITSQCKIKLSPKYCPWINLQTNLQICVTPSFNEWVVFSWLLYFALQYMFIQIGSQTWASLSFVLPGRGANSSLSCRSCLFSGHKKRCWTVLFELRYNAAYNPNTFFLNCKQRTVGNAVEGALRYIKKVCSKSLNQNCQGIF